MTTRLKQLINFVREIEKLQRIKREIYYPDKSQENDAEHSWHVAMIVMTLANEFDPKADKLKMLKMALIHDLVEIYAGDTFLFDEEGQKTKEKRELDAAKKLFKILPEDIAKEFWELFEEFEALATAEAKIVKSIDHLQPLIHQMIHGGVTYKMHKLSPEKHDSMKRPKMLHNENILTLYNDLYAEAKSKRIFYQGSTDKG